MAELNDAIHDHSEFIRSVADRLNTLSWALDMAGLTKLATELADIADSLFPSAKAISAAYNGELNERVRHSKETAGLRLKAVLAIRSPTLPSPKHQSGE